ncbi:caspase family protein [Mucilaginibacter pedocola]|uniref:Peptidase C14 caspase domain-containing protein n=1 Tax=Mucilaginibacter pedocola TaxID=1792845 RepID=A0A1S9PDB8_9SPHI|nr:caspase family protein [Mucilaginibacter pedocola]OOQ58945.1 hypothetical protein BC343_30215 [Mucilaginibacter pedocola]
MRYLITLLLAFISAAGMAQKLELRIPIAHTSYVQGLAISPDEKYIATASSDKSVKIWSMANGMQLKTLPLKQGAADEVHFSADSRYLTVRTENGWEYWDVLAGKQVYLFEKGLVKDGYKIGATVSADGSLGAVVNPVDILIWDAANGTRLKAYKWKAPDADGSLNGNGIKLNKKYIAITQNKKLQVFSLETGKKVDFDQPDPEVQEMAITANSNMLLVNGKTKMYKVDLDSKVATIISDAVYGLTGLSFSADDKNIIMAPRAVLDAATNRELKHFYDTEYNDLMGASSKYIVVFNRANSSGKLYSATTFEKLRELKNETSGLQRMMVKAATNQLIFTTNAREARIWNVSTYKFEKTVPFNTREAGDWYNSAFGNQGDYYLTGNFGRQTVVNINTGEASPAYADRGVKAISPDGTIGFTDKSGAGSIINFATGNVIKTIDFKYPRYLPSPDNKTVIYQHYPDAKAFIYNYRQNTEITADVELGEYPVFNNTGSKLYSLDAVDGEGGKAINLLTTSVSTGQQLSKIPLVAIQRKGALKFAVSPDEKYAAVLYRPTDEYYMSKNYVLVTYDLGTGKEISRANDIMGGDEIAFLGNNYLVAMMSVITNTVQVFNAITTAHLVDLAHFKGTDDWIAVTPDGLYDGNMESLKKFYFVRGNEFVDPGAYFEKFYTPNLFARLVAGERFTPVDVNINPAPKVRISYAQVTRNLNVVDDKTPTYVNTTGVAEITVTASAENDRVDEIRLFHNGKIVNLATRGLFVTDNNTHTDTKKYTLNLLPGVNSIRAVALNSQRTESEPDEIAVTYNAAGQPNTPAPINNGNGFIAQVDRKATMHLIVIGINAYKNPKMSLNYALADATAFKNEAEKDAHTVLAKLNTYFITDDKADKAGITAAFAEVQKNAKPEDVFVFYYAGHGVISEKNKEFYLVPNDVTDLKNVDEALAQNGIPSKMLQQYAINIAAQKQVFILDACQSAGAFQQLMADNAGALKSLALVARSTGTHWIAASGSQQFAQEFAQLGHGAFTYVLLDAMKGGAINNKMITVNGLKSFLQIKVPDLMKKYNGAPQYPSSYGFGSDFPLELIGLAGLRLD